jgi:hypothetical protein
MLPVDTNSVKNGSKTLDFHPTTVSIVHRSASSPVAADM